MDVRERCIDILCEIAYINSENIDLACERFGGDMQCSLVRIEREIADTISEMKKNLYDLII